jgi:hypothetical protein
MANDEAMDKKPTMLPIQQIENGYFMVLRGQPTSPLRSIKIERLPDTRIALTFAPGYNPDVDEEAIIVLAPEDFEAFADRVQSVRSRG